MILMTDQIEHVGYLERKQKQLAHAAVIGINFNDPRPPSREVWLCHRDYAHALAEHAEDFSARSGAKCGTGFGDMSEYDRRVTIHPSNKAGAYIAEARKIFSNFTFVQTINPRERPLGAYQISGVIPKRMD